MIKDVITAFGKLQEDYAILLCVSAVLISFAFFMACAKIAQAIILRKK